MTDAQETALWRQAVRDHIAALPEQLDERIRAVERMRRAFHAELAAAVAPTFNAKLKEMDRRTKESRRELCSWANTSARSLGLAIKCPNTGKPAALYFSPGGINDKDGRFTLEVKTDRGTRTKSWSSARSLPTFDLTIDPPRIEALSHAARTVRTRSENSAREL